MNEAILASDTLYAIKVESGKNFFWCSCSQSGKHPLCDGSQGDSSFTPVKYMATVSKEMFFCGCKATASQPMCDGSHKNI